MKKIPIPLSGVNLWRGQKIGLMGGSFNPAHKGHLHISLEALKRLGLNHVWWLVAPQNPLKSKSDMAGYEERLASAAAFARHPRIHALDLERRLGTRYTIDTLKALRRHYPASHFVWLMGADNLVTFTEWKDWQAIMQLIPVAVFDRPGYALQGLTGKVAVRYQEWRYLSGQFQTLAGAHPPAWAFIFCNRHFQSSTALRKSGEAFSDRTSMLL